MTAAKGRHGAQGACSHSVKPTQATGLTCRSSYPRGLGGPSDGHGPLPLQSRWKIKRLSLDNHTMECAATVWDGHERGHQTHKQRVGRGGGGGQNCRGAEQWSALTAHLLQHQDRSCAGLQPHRPTASAPACSRTWVQLPDNRLRALSTGRPMTVSRAATSRGARRSKGPPAPLDSTRFGHFAMRTSSWQFRKKNRRQFGSEHDKGRGGWVCERVWIGGGGGDGRRRPL
jgi:hypothetical protein